ncbi:serine hydrolase domain-containing protein [Emcibacter sp. SYSU 3D8]|uniref:serine hydrolase domain-containing protein n=1 Tax=Emcibacter sp. SYSU 3D8 TaxID=3133969 RepID=UPI0031FE932D
MAGLLAPAGGLAGGLPEGDSASHGFSPDRLARIDDAMQRWVDDGKLAGVTIAVARDGKLVYDRSVGMADIARGLPMTGDTLVRIYSMTKAVTVVAALILVEEGKLRLTDPVSSYLPEFAGTGIYVDGGPDTPNTRPPKSPPRIFHLMTHTSGLSYPGGYDTTAVGTIYDRKDVFNPRNTLAELSKKTASIPLTDEPGNFHYGASIDILGRVIEVASGKPLDKFLRERLFAPLKMNDTMFTVPASLRGRFAELYTSGPDGKLAVLRDGAGLGLYETDARLLSGGGGLVSTTYDYLRFCQMMLNGGELDGARILVPKTVQLMTTGQVSPDRRGTLKDFSPGYDMGLGFGVLEDPGASGMPGSAGEFRWGGAASTEFFIDPQEKIVAVLSTQFMPSDAHKLREDMKALIYQALTAPDR